MLFVHLSVLIIILLMMSDTTQFCQGRRIKVFISGIINNFANEDYGRHVESTAKADKMLSSEGRKQFVDCLRPFFGYATQFYSHQRAQECHNLCAGTDYRSDSLLRKCA